MQGTRLLGGGGFRDLIEYAGQWGLDPVLRLVPECSLASLPAGFEAKERTDSFDYIFAIDALINPAISKVRRNHRLANDYRAANPAVVIRELSLNSPHVLLALGGIDRAWRSGRANNGTSAWEQCAFDRCLELQSEFSLKLIMAFSGDGTPLGFILGEILENSFFLVHFTKTLSHQRGLGHLLFLEACLAARTSGCLWLNFQEDHGVAGLRQMKRSWNPINQLRVYDVRPA